MMVLANTIENIHMPPLMSLADGIWLNQVIETLVLLLAPLLRMWLKRLCNEVKLRTRSLVLLGPALMKSLKNKYHCKWPYKSMAVSAGKYKSPRYDPEDYATFVWSESGRRPKIMPQEAAIKKFIVVPNKLVSMCLNWYTVDYEIHRRPACPFQISRATAKNLDLENLYPLGPI